MTNNNKKLKFTEDNFSAINVNSLAVIREVKKHRVIYDMEYQRYHDQPYRNTIWEQIYTALYPNYWRYSGALRTQIGILVRRRWKSVRNYIAQECKLMLTTDFNRKKESSQWRELKFILPYIKSPYCEKIAAELGITRMEAEEGVDTPDSDTNNDDDEQSYEPNNEDEGYVIQEFIKEEETLEYTDEDDLDNINDVDDYINPALTVPYINGEDPIIKTTRVERVHPVVLHYNTNQSSTPPMLTPKPSSEKDNQSTEPPRKRPRNNVEDYNSSDVQSKLLELLINIEHQQVQAQMENGVNDIDRMFFLSLLPDFKQISDRKKISVKAKIATLIAEAMD